jgi:hypothetical protein
MQMFRFLLFFSLLYNLSNADMITVNGVDFTDQEQNQTFVVLSYSSYQDFLNLSLSQTSVLSLMNCRDTNQIGFTCASSLSSSELRRIREYSYLVTLPDQNITMNSYNPLGIKVYEFNFLNALMGGLIGFSVLLFFLYTITNISRGLKD